MKKEEILKYVGSINQIGGVKDYILNDGKAKGVRAIEINTGNLSFVILPDRGMDIANAYYKNTALSWISKAGITAPQYYDKEGLSWLRSFYGGLVATCGLKHMGGPVGENGLHGRISNIPAEKVSVFADWVGDEYVMKVSGDMRESNVFGENLVLKRTITAKLFCDEFTVEDTVVNEGFNDEKFVLCYHCNFGYPLVREGSKLVNIPNELGKVTAPIHNIDEELHPVFYEDKTVTVGIENGEIGTYITYDRDTLPDFLLWKKLSESDYVIGLEPRTTWRGGQDLVDNDAYITLSPFEEYNTKLKFEAKDLK